MTTPERHAATVPASPSPFAGWLEAGADPSKPSIARVYDYWLGGRRNLVVDRELGERMARLDPRIPAACKANRAFLGRAVRYLAHQGIRQFLDLGCGIPTAGNVHEVARQAAPGARVVYVDRDPVAVTEGRKLLAGDDATAVIQADIRDPRSILAAAGANGLIDFARPVGLMLVAILHFVLDADDPHGITAAFRDAAAEGSYLVVSHVTSEASPRLTAAVQSAYNVRAADGQARPRKEITRFFGDWDLVEPGLVYSPAWRPDQPQDVPAAPERLWFLAGAARKPEPGRA